MPLYTKAATDLVYDLINEENPGLTKTVTPNNVSLGTPTAISGTSWPAANTSIVLTAKGYDFSGKQTVKYRRLDLSSLFRGQTVQISKFKDLTKIGSSAKVFSIYDLLPDINAKYGVQLTTADITDGTITRGNTQENGQYTNTVTVTATASSLGFIGSFSLKWLNTEQDLAAIWTVLDIPGRLFPGGNDFSGTHKTIFDSANYGYDYTDVMKAAAPTLSNNSTVLRAAVSTSTGSINNLNALLTSINNTLGTAFQITSISGGYLSNVNELSGMKYSLVTLTSEAPHATFPQANNIDFNKCWVIEVPDDCTWASGILYFHYNAYN